MIVLVVSDLHLGKGKYLRNGQLNILEDFNEDKRFAEFLDHYSGPDYRERQVHLVLNGDILNLIQMDVDGVFSHIQNESYTLRAMEGIVEGHPDFFESLRRFLAHPGRKLTYVIGNHDFSIVWPKVQDRFREILGGPVDFTMVLHLNGVHIEHGHRYEPLNSVAPSKTFIQGPNGQRILNLPWASLFCISLVPILRKERPFIDRVRPLSLYIRRALVSDTLFFLNVTSTILKYVVRTAMQSYNRYNHNFRMSWRHVKNISIYPRYERFARRILARRNDVSVVVMGHTHLAEWRRFPEGKIYLNCGTWNPIPSIDAGLHESIMKHSYVCIEFHPETKKVQNAYLNVWHGQWRPYIEEASLTMGSRIPKKSEP